MKKIILNTFLLIAITVNSQTIIPLESYDGTREPYAYYQDANNVLDNFVGTWVYTNGDTVLKIVLKKITMSEIPSTHIPYFEDVLIGEYQYIENGVQKINTLNTMYPLETYHGKRTINGNNIIFPNDYPLCNDCSSDEKRLKLSCYDPVKEVYYKLTLRKKIIGGIQKLFISIYSSGIRYDFSDPNDIFTANPVAVGTTIPQGNYELIKQP